MGKYEVEIEVTGFKLRIKGERSDQMGDIARQVGNQFVGMLQPASEIVDPDATPLFKAVANEAAAPRDTTERKKAVKKRASTRRSKTNGESTGSQPLVWQHNSSKWGAPKQTWSAAQKITWLLYVIAKELDLTEVGGPTIAETFNAKFKQFGALQKQSMNRDLGSLKTRQPLPWVLDNTTVSPIAWYLTDEGFREAEKLVIEAKGGAQHD